MKTIFGGLFLLLAVAMTTGCSAKHGPGCHRWGCGVFGDCFGCGCKDTGCTTGGCTTPGCTDGGCTTGNCAQAGGTAAGCSTCGPNGQCGGHCAGHCSGCGSCLHHGCQHCNHCGLACVHNLLAKHHKQYTDIGAQNYPSGPPTGTVAYPYYTTRGPRDFYTANPPSIGP